MQYSGNRLQNIWHLCDNTLKFCNFSISLNVNIPCTSLDVL